MFGLPFNGFYFTGPVEPLAPRREVHEIVGSRDPSALSLGRLLAEDADMPNVLYGGDRHVVVFGPNGSGKGTRWLIPNLLRNTGRSIIVVDPKGELAAVTAAYRSTISDVVILNPFNVLGMGGSPFNPLRALDPEAPMFFDDACGLSEALIKIEGKDPHWPESAQALTTALIMWEAIKAQREGRVPTLDNVRWMLTEPDRWEPAPGRKSKRQVAGLAMTVEEMIREGGYEIASLIGRFMDATDEMANIRSTANTQTRWILSQPICDSMNGRGLDFASLKDRPRTVYLVLPAERLRTHSVWLRLALVSALHALYRPGGLSTLMMIDEFAALGHLAPIEDAFALVRGYGIAITAVLQDLGQLKALYKERWETFLANAGAVVGFTPNDLTTAEWMSRRSGDTTVVAASRNHGSGSSTGGQGSANSHSGVSYQQVGRRMLLPQEIYNMREGHGLVWLAGLANPLAVYLPAYWEIRRARERASPNPYYRG